MIARLPVSNWLSVHTDAKSAADPAAHFAVRKPGQPVRDFRAEIFGTPPGYRPVRYIIM